MALTLECIDQEVRDFVAGTPLNRLPDGGACFDVPLLGCAAADDPLFIQLQTIVGPFHLLPRELLPDAASVLVWILPVTLATRASNRDETLWPSRAWAQTRFYGEQCNTALRRHMVAWLEGQGQRAVAPQLSPLWQELAATPVGIASRWSERHAAYAAGLGTFSLNDGLITKRGIAHRIGSVVTDLVLPPTPRTAPNHLHHCLFHREGSCGVCIGRCPVGALSHAGHDKGLCREHVYGAAPRAVAELYGVAQTGCGLCQTAVPCESAIPSGRRG